MTTPAKLRNPPGGRIVISQLKWSNAHIHARQQGAKKTAGYVSTTRMWRTELPPDHLLLDSAPNLGPLISSWEINKFENCWYKSVRILEILKLLFQQFLNLSSSQRDMSGLILGDLSNNRWSGSSIPRPVTFFSLFGCSKTTFARWSPPVREESKWAAVGIDVIRPFGLYELQKRRGTVRVRKVSMPRSAGRWKNRRTTRVIKLGNQMLLSPSPGASHTCSYCLR
jgi:hypothetical protein